jgi:hypothetical protein
VLAYGLVFGDERRDAVGLRMGDDETVERISCPVLAERHLGDDGERMGADFEPDFRVQLE